MELTIIQGYRFYKSPKFHTHAYVSDTLIKEAVSEQFSYIKDCICNGIFDISVTHDFTKIIGTSHCIECPPHAKGVYFKRRGRRPYLSRMIKGKEPQETTLCTVVLRYNETAKEFIVISAWTGGQSKPELGNINYFERCTDPVKEIMESAIFWTSHALIEENDERG
ncbi:MAG: hypothetical protein IJ898_00805 [Prevotella sp.]|nr:hypothetical protein [Prevotella sp.]